MSKKTSNYSELAIKNLNTMDADQPVLPIVLVPEYSGAEEAIGALSAELIKSGKTLSIEELQLIIIVKLKLSTEIVQKNILREALIMITNKTLL